MPELKARNLLSLNQKDALKVSKSFDLVITDCDGVLWHCFEVIPDAGAGVMALKQAGKQVKFISRNSVRSDAEYIQKLRSIGITDVKPNDIITPGKVMLNHLRQCYSGLRVFSLCSDELNELFRRNGIKIDTIEPSVNISVNELVQKITPGREKISAVIYDLNFNITYSQLAKAQQYLIMDNCVFIVGSIDTFIPVSKNFAALGTLGIISILRECCGKEPVSLGKSGTTFSEEIISGYNIRDPKRVLYIGDNLISDVPFGNNCGFQTLFVYTGLSKTDQMKMLSEQHKPDYVLKSIAEFAKFFELLGPPQ